jgi:hypothetical protein
MEHSRGWWAMARACAPVDRQELRVSMVSVVDRDGERRWRQSGRSSRPHDGCAHYSLRGTDCSPGAKAIASLCRRNACNDLACRSLRRMAQWNRTMIDTIGKPWEIPESFDLMSKIDPDQALAVDDR